MELDWWILVKSIQDRRDDKCIDGSTLSTRLNTTELNIFVDREKLKLDKLDSSGVLGGATITGAAGRLYR